MSEIESAGTHPADHFAALRGAIGRMFTANEAIAVTPGAADDSCQDFDDVADDAMAAFDALAPDLLDEIEELIALLHDGSPPHPSIRKGSNS